MLDSRSDIACLRCRKSKTKCQHEGMPPCRACEAICVQCVFAEKTSRKGEKRKRRAHSFEPDQQQLLITSPSSPAQLELPPKSVQEELLDLFFNRTHNVGAAHKPSWMRQLREGTVDPLLVYGMICVCFRDRNVAGVPSHHYVRKLREYIFSTLETPSVSKVYALTLAASDAWGSSNGVLAWTLLGVAVRMAYALRLHMAETYVNVPFIRAEYWRRVMWNCYIVDRLQSSGRGRPRAVHDADLEIALPCDEADFFFGNEVVVEKLDGSDEHGTGKVGLMGYMVRIISCWSKLTRVLLNSKNDVPPWEPGSLYHSLLEMVESWEYSLPPEQQFSQLNIDGHLSSGTGFAYALNHTVHQTSVISLHRRYISVLSAPTTPDSWRESSIAGILDAARKIKLIVISLEPFGGSELLPAFIVFSTYIAASTVTYLALQKLLDSKEALDIVRPNLDSLKIMQNKWTIAQGWYRTLASMVNALHSKETTSVNQQLTDEYGEVSKQPTRPPTPSEPTETLLTPYADFAFQADAEIFWDGFAIGFQGIGDDYISTFQPEPWMSLP